MKIVVLLFLITSTACNALQSNSPSGPNTKAVSIHDIYVLVQCDGKNVKNILEKPASLEINLTEMAMMGNDGCNDFSGKIVGYSADKNTLTFNDITATEMYCNETSNKIGNALYKVKKYKREGMELQLLSEKGEVLLSYKKVD